ncbi:hypothetical protein BASA50_010123 [Batrachochytrium salamandrivorans]|uniref:MICOS complex subunit MIC10 n=1 Tax=Batrachochytrium salamandrivorans TaxID=1357716 RepID=A0ABQ8F2L1_9FUNG|nr:hypothetical protein BASA62_002375 [Batrachochytrium salamandrivorans]KAH6580775.1 hypothetical protein BASA60_002736 [Batrachochytrium salamandrivorans]KAH6589377.1 hypothetical protein BASA50_010123 [Batrachochytrium salamandrivorans]KAH6595080.1 hypothetical protein BASA61_003865 [Batrachochytrium salamandrivorans]KAH9268130.1 hypothetical protein BASA83_009522 [Batrachochytrium salamandrivorans]
MVKCEIDGEMPEMKISINDAPYSLSQLEKDTILGRTQKRKNYVSNGALIGASSGVGIAFLRGCRLPGHIGFAFMGLAIGVTWGVSMKWKSYLHDVINLPHSPLTGAIRTIFSNNDELPAEMTPSILRCEFGPLLAVWDQTKNFPSKTKRGKSLSKYGDESMEENC